MQGVCFGKRLSTAASYVEVEHLMGQRLGSSFMSELFVRRCGLFFYLLIPSSSNLECSCSSNTKRWGRDHYDHYYQSYYYFHCHCWWFLHHHRFPHHWWVHWHRRSYHCVFVNGISWVTAAGPFAPQGLKLLGIVPNWVAQETRVYILLLHEGSA